MKMRPRVPQLACLTVTLLATVGGSHWAIAADADVPEPSTPTERIRHAVQKEIDAGLFPGSVVGVAPLGQDEGGPCTIGHNNVLREHVIVEAGGDPAGEGTVIGPENLLMVAVQIGHDARLDGHGIFANLTRIEPHARRLSAPRDALPVAATSGVPSAPRDSRG